ncbi:MAG: hypothetical protein M0Q95_03445 [Porticoccaceae bacterium]|nr:hypothetical protein [Porticoccaceae bacterium]
MLVRRYSLRTIKSYLYWIKLFIRFNRNNITAHLAPGREGHVRRYARLFSAPGVCRV